VSAVLYDPRMAILAGVETVQAWKPPVAGVREVFHARFTEHAYPPHTHGTWTLFIVDEGSIRYDLDRHAHGAEPPMVSILPPHVVHDGRPATSHGFHKRVLYLEADVIGEALIGPAVDRPVLADPLLRREVSALHHVLLCADDALEAETRLAFVAERIRLVLGGSPKPSTPASTDVIAEQLRAILDDSLAEPITLAVAADRIGAYPTQVARAFTKAFGIPPHAYLLGRRLEAARDRILEGQPLADVAAEVGFTDQAHLTHRFRRYLGVTPGRYARAGSPTPIHGDPRARRARRHHSRGPRDILSA
jgi:AraC-like DNA-binding protein